MAIDEASLGAAFVVHRIVGALAPEATQEVTPQRDLRDDLGFHSLALVELAFLIEDAFALDPIPREEAELVRLVGEITTYVENKAAERGYLFLDEDRERVVVLLEDLESWDGE